MERHSRTFQVSFSQLCVYGSCLVSGIWLKRSSLQADWASYAFYLNIYLRDWLNNTASSFYENREVNRRLQCPGRVCSLCRVLYFFRKKFLSSQLIILLLGHGWLFPQWFFLPSFCLCPWSWALHLWFLWIKADDCLMLSIITSHSRNWKANIFATRGSQCKSFSWEVSKVKVLWSLKQWRDFNWKWYRKCWFVFPRIMQ